MPRSHIYSLLALSSLYLVNLEAETPAEEICGKAPRPMRITTRHIEGNGIGYNRGYTTIEGFLAPYQYDRWLPFVDVRGHVLNDGQLASNVGLGVRYKTDTRIWGLNTYYDYRNSNHYHYNQVAMGLESLGRLWDFRINGYLPVGAKTSHAYGWTDDTLQGHYWMLKAKREFAMRGLSGEAGFHVDHFHKFPLYFAAGPYYLQGKGDPAWGGQIRAAVEVSETLRLEGNTSYDNRFKWIGQGQISLIIPLGHKKKVKKTNLPCSRVMALETRALQKVDRFEIIPVDTQKRTAIAVDPATGMPYFISNVDAGGNSNGTTESPFAKLSDALEQIRGKPGGIAYVSGAGFKDAFDANEEGRENGYTLPAGTQLLGAGRGHRLQTQYGPLVLAARGSNPQLINSRTDRPLDPSVVLNMEDNTKISAALISGTAGIGIQSAGYDGAQQVQGIQIQNVVVNQINLGANTGIRLKGSSKINKSLVNLRSFNDDVTGIDLEGSGSITRSLIRGQTLAGAVTGIRSSGVDVVGNRVNLETQSGLASGITLSTSSSTTLTSASGNNITVSGGEDVYGLKVSFTEDNARADISLNTIKLTKNGNTYATGNAKGVWVDNPRDGSTAILTVNNITIDQNIGTASGVYVDNTGSMDLQITDNPNIQVVNLGDGTNTGTGIYIKPTGTFTNAVLSNNIINLQTFVNSTISPTPSSGPDAYGINAPVSSNGLTVDFNTINITRVGSGYQAVADGYGIAVIYNEASSTSTLTNNAITVAGDGKYAILGKAYGIHVDTNDKQSCTNIVDGGSVDVSSGADAIGIYVVPSSSGTTTATIQNISALNVSSSAADAYGIQVDDTTGSTVAFTLDGITTANISGFNNAYGIDLGLINFVDLLSVTNSVWNVKTGNSSNTGSGYGIRACAITDSDAIISGTTFSVPPSGSLFNNSYGIYLKSNLDNSQISLTGNPITVKAVDSSYGI
ncbi:MAG: inverse autotransporter beta domain-containing protein, partial [Chlamydiae bacterium]|nr:inverse autotransporter beta domain-containing protein [Chlamydiota bacterium]